QKQSIPIGICATRTILICYYTPKTSRVPLPFSKNAVTEKLLYQTAHSLDPATLLIPAACPCSSTPAYYHLPPTSQSKSGRAASALPLAIRQPILLRPTTRSSKCSVRHFHLPRACSSYGRAMP